MKHFLTGVGTLVLCVAVSGCVSAPGPEAHVNLPQQYEHAGDIAAQSDGDLTAWWHAFEDPALSRLVEDALASSPDARSALSVLRQAKAERSSQLLSLWPQGAATVSQSQSGGSLSRLGQSVTTTTSPTSWEIDLFQVPQSVSLAGAQFARARFDYEATRVALAAEVANQVIRIEGQTQQLADARESLRISEELLRIARVKVERGLAASSDVAGFESDRATARANVTQLEEAVRASRRTLLVLLGRGTEATANLDIGVATFNPPVVPASLPAALIAQRPDVRRSAAALAVATGNETVARLGFFPSLIVQPTQTSVKGVAGQTWTLTGTVTQALFNLPQVATQVRIQSEISQQALIAYQQNVQTAFGEADNALGAYAADQARLGDLMTAEHQALIAFEAEKTRYGAGYSDQTALLQKEQIWRQARTALIAAQTTTLTDAVSAYKALGGGWTPPYNAKDL
jgi:multidrug efflux system outer membrane protein